MGRAPPPGEQPLGITVLSILAALGGAALVLAGLAMSTAGGATLLRLFLPLPPVAGAALAAAGTASAVLGLALGGVAWGLWVGRPWAWSAAVALTLLGLGAGAFSLPSGALSILVNLGLLWYLTREGVEQWFRKVGAWPTKPVDEVLERLAHR